MPHLCIGMTADRRLTVREPSADGLFNALLDAFVVAWVTALCRPTYVPLAPDELHQLLGRAARRLCDAGLATPPDLAGARRVGASLVDADLIDPEALPSSIATVAQHLPELIRQAGIVHSHTRPHADPQVSPHADRHAAVAAVQSALAGGYLA